MGYELVDFLDAGMIGDDDIVYGRGLRMRVLVPESIRQYLLSEHTLEILRNTLGILKCAFEPRGAFECAFESCAVGNLYPSLLN